MIESGHDNLPSQSNDNTSPTKERHQRNGGVYAELIRRDPEGYTLIKRYRAVWECPLDAYRDYGLINAEGYKAGLKFRRLYYATSICRETNEHGLMEGDDIQVAKRERVLKSALRQMPANSQRAVIDVCGHSEPARNAAALEALRKGLSELAVLWHRVAIETCEHKNKK